MSQVSNLFKLGSAVALAVSLSSAQAALVDFTGAAEGGVFTNPTGSSNGPSLYVAQGFEFAATGVDGHFHQNFNSGDSLFMHTNFGDTTTNNWVLTVTGGGAFDLHSFEMLQVNNGFNWITDTGASGTVTVGTNTLNLTGIHSFTFVLDASFSSAEVTSISADAAKTVPEPTALALVLAALGGAGVAARRRKQA